MKKTLISLLILVAVALAAGSLYSVAGNLVDHLRNDKAVTGSGNLLTRTFDVAPFTAIRSRHAAHITVVEGSGPVTVKVDDNLAPHVVVRTEKGRLLVGFDDEIHNMRNITFEVTVPSDGKLDKLKASGASKIIVEPVVKGGEIEIDASGASKIVAMVECRKCAIDASGASKVEIGGHADHCSTDASGASKIGLAIGAARCDIEVSGASKVEAQGSADKCYLDASGASKIDATGLKTLDAVVENSGASSVGLYCNRSLKASASGAGKIAYKSDGPIALSTTSSGAGKVKTL